MDITQYSNWGVILLLAQKVSNSDDSLCHSMPVFDPHKNNPNDTCLTGGQWHFVSFYTLTQVMLLINMIPYDLQNPFQPKPLYNSVIFKNKMWQSCYMAELKYQQHNFIALELLALSLAPVSCRVCEFPWEQESQQECSGAPVIANEH